MCVEGRQQHNDEEDEEESEEERKTRLKLFLEHIGYEETNSSYPISSPYPVLRFPSSVYGSPTASFRPFRSHCRTSLAQSLEYLAYLALDRPPAAPS